MIVSLTAVLGEPPEEPTAPSRWREAAVRIETYRHAELGQDPAEGSVVDEPGPAGVIGPRPEDYVGAVVWDTWPRWRRPSLHLSWNRRGWTWGYRTGVGRCPGDQGHASETDSS